MKRLNTFILLTLIAILALGLRLHKINNPIADWHSFRQADTASVTREYIKHGVDLLHPRYHDLSNIQSGKDNRQGYRMVEFPVLNGVTAVIIKTFGGQQHEVLVGRLVSVTLSLLTLISIYLIGSQLSGKITGLAASFLFATLPYSIYYSRVILPEPALLATSTLAIALFIHALKNNQTISLILSLFSFALALLIKPYAVFLYPTFIIIYLLYSPHIIKDAWKLVLFILVTPLPLLWWRKWITQFPEGIPASDWLYNKDNIRFKGAFFYWVFEQRISILILGIGNLVLLALGLIKKGRDLWVYLVWLLGLIAYLVIFAGGNVQHDYYQVFLLPLLVLLAGRGVQFIFELPHVFIQKQTIYPLLLTLVGFSLFVSWYQVRGYYQVNHWEIIEAGQAVDNLTPPEAKVIAPYNGDTAFLFQTNRTGWPIGYYLDKKIKQGATYYVSVNFDDETNALLKKYETVVKNDRYVIINLQKSL